MSYATTTLGTATVIGHALGRVMTGIWGALMALSEFGPKMAEVTRLNALSDDDLAARGLTRAGEVQRIFGQRMYL
ncbi:MAG: hypothetical protein U1D06_12080 [Paracoccaceae bacterium]|nr:hypothetical protein [Paracoccaceae bacterium]